MKLLVKITEQDLEEMRKLRSQTYLPYTYNKTNVAIFGIWGVFVSEVKRNCRIWVQNLFSPFVNAILYFLVFGTILGKSLPEIDGLPYIKFLVPGFLVSPLTSAAYSSGAFNSFMKIFFNHIQDLQMSPLRAHGWLIGNILSSIARAFLITFWIWLSSFIFTGSLYIAHPFTMVLLVIVVSSIFSLLGNINGVYSRSFEEISLIPVFVITPLLYISGIFFNINELPLFFAKLSLLNPLTYIVSTMRYVFNGGVPTYDITLSFVILIAVLIVLYVLNIKILRKKLNIE